MIHTAQLVQNTFGIVSIDSLCVEIVCRIAASKYLTMGMLCDFLELQGLCAARSQVKARPVLLEFCGFVQRIICHVGSQVTLRCYSLGENGDMLAQQAGVANYRSLRYPGRFDSFSRGVRQSVLWPGYSGELTQKEAA